MTVLVRVYLKDKEVYVRGNRLMNEQDERLIIEIVKAELKGRRRP